MNYKSMLELAKNSFYGTGGMARDEEKAVGFYKSAAGQGSVEAQEFLGNYYFDKGDYASATEFFTQYTGNEALDCADSDILLKIVACARLTAEKEKGGAAFDDALRICDNYEETVGDGLGYKELSLLFAGGKLNADNSMRKFYLNKAFDAGADLADDEIQLIGRAAEKDSVKAKAQNKAAGINTAFMKDSLTVAEAQNLFFGHLRGKRGVNKEFFEKMTAGEIEVEYSLVYEPVFDYYASASGCLARWSGDGEHSNQYGRPYLHTSNEENTFSHFCTEKAYAYKNHSGVGSVYAVFSRSTENTATDANPDFIIKPYDQSIINSAKRTAKNSLSKNFEIEARQQIRRKTAYCKNIFVTVLSIDYNAEAEALIYFPTCTCKYSYNGEQYTCVVSNFYLLNELVFPVGKQAIKSTDRRVIKNGADITERILTVISAAWSFIIGAVFFNRYFAYNDRVGGMPSEIVNMGLIVIFLSMIIAGIMLLSSLIRRACKTKAKPATYKKLSITGLIFACIFMAAQFMTLTVVIAAFIDMAA